jgi:Transposase
MEFTRCGLDIAKQVFQVHGVNEHGVVKVRKTLPRGKVLQFFAQRPPCIIGIEACGSAHYWGRELSKLGHTVKLMAAQFVMAYRKRGKNDANDAEAICEAVGRPNMRFVAMKSPEQQAVLMVHRARARVVTRRTALVNQTWAVGRVRTSNPKGRCAAAEQLESIPDSAERLVLATGRYIGEGFDNARLDTLFLAMPVSWKGTLIQYSGRLHRLHPSKTEVRIHDYVDRQVLMLLRMFEKRLPTYRAIGYARGEAPLGFAEAAEVRTVEYDREALRHLNVPQ